MAEHASLSNKAQKYEEFIDKLKTKLLDVLEERKKKGETLAEYFELKKMIELIQSEKLSKLHSRVDLGFNTYCQAKIPDTSKIFLDVGLGFHVEYTLAEALRVIDKKCARLTSEADHLTKDNIRIKADIKFLQEAWRESQGIPDTPLDKPQRDF